jgi:hypothetical protein
VVADMAAAVEATEVEAVVSQHSLRINPATR